MDLVNIIEELTLQHKQLVVVWDTTKDLFLCHIKSMKSKKLYDLSPDLNDVIVDRAIDKIYFGSDPREYTKGQGTLYVYEGKVWLRYTSLSRLKRQSAPVAITMEIEHPQEIAKNLNRSHLIFELSINDRGFIRQDIKPSIEEGDAYTLGTHVLEKYRLRLQQILQQHHAEIHKVPEGEDYEVVFTGIVRGLGDKTFLKTVYWFDVFTEEKSVTL